MLEYQFVIRQYLLRKMREFFLERGYIEVETPYLVRSVPPDPHIDPVCVYISGKGPYYLHTSPEIHMKKLLSKGLRRIFQICRVFRVESVDSLHRIEFTMLEWYRDGTYMDTLKEAEDLVLFLSSSLHEEFSIKKRFFSPFSVLEMEALFLERVGINPFEFDRTSLFRVLKERGFLTVREEDTWDEMFFKVFFEKIEPHIDKSVPYFLVGWPLATSSMAKERNGRAERFELYIDGIEIANGYSELLDPEEQRKRFEKDNELRKYLGKDEIPIDEDFISSLSRIPIDCSGVALGIERLIMVLTGERTIDSVSPFSL
ncbi:MAG: EF-P lysine aminoacylase EpmA [Desulfobacterota bacterium]|nr:EF-P lysine aminoacylase EpmA [Thermodesulfobacteriota bacterium]MDW8001844.1 EF-P lysine aminoacylase EpmA [Deltaproteobacteria bacterium]